jgi:hypothetical protein
MGGNILGHKYCVCVFFCTTLVCSDKPLATYAPGTHARTHTHTWLIVKKCPTLVKTGT